MITVHIEHTVVDFDGWKATFDRFEQFRRDHAVRSYRLSRVVGDENRVVIELDFDGLGRAESFRDDMQQVWAGSQAQDILVDRPAATVLGVVESRRLSAAESAAS